MSGANPAEGDVGRTSKGGGSQRGNKESHHRKWPCSPVLFAYEVRIEGKESSSYQFCEDAVPVN